MKYFVTWKLFGHGTGPGRCSTSLVAQITLVSASSEHNNNNNTGFGEKCGKILVQSRSGLRSCRRHWPHNDSQLVSVLHVTMPDPLKYFWFLIVERLLILLLCCGARGEGSAPMFSDCRFWSDPGHHVKYLKQKMVSHREHILIIYCYVILGKPKSIDIVIFFLFVERRGI